MKKLKNNQILSMIGIVTLFLVIIGLVNLMNVDKYAGKVKMSKVSVSNISSKYSANVIDATTSDNASSKGYDEITYTVSYNLSASTDASNRSVLLRASLDDNEDYAIFKDITKDNVTSTLSNGGKQIDVVIDNVNVELDNKINLVIVVQGAPNGHNIKPSIEIKESTEDNYTSISTSKIVVNTNSLSGKVTDENNAKVSNIELALLKNNVVIKKVYTNEEGTYVFSDIEEGTYDVLIDEEIYEKVKENTTSVNGDNNLDIKVKSVEPYKIETKKLITKLVVEELGAKQEFTYGEVPKVVQSLKNYYGFTGQIEYVVKVKNTGKKSGIVTVVKDEIPNGLTFDKNKNYGWENVDGVLYNRNLEGITLKAGQERTEKLVLDITKTNEAKTYLNKVVAKGELYERVVFVLNGEKYKELDVVEGEKIDNVEVLSDSFSGWYTDENLTNKYNFKNEVNKDLILYGVTDIVKHKVTFIDDNPETKSKDLYDEQEVVDGKSPRKPSDPEHNGYEFKCWVKQNNECFDFDEEKITDEIELTSTYETIKYTITYKGLTEEEKTELNNPVVYTVESEDFTLNNPDRNGYNFLGWTEKDSDDPTINKTIVKGTTGNKVITANFNTIEYTITYNLNGGSLEEGETNPNTYTVKTEDFTLNNPKKAGYTFVGWEGTGLGSATKNVTIRKGSTGNREYTAVYETKNYTITYKGLTDEEKASLNNPTEYTIESDDITITNPQDRYDNDGDLSEIFVGWEGTGIEGTTNNVVIAKGSKGNREYTAKFETASPDSYPITYNLNGGSLEEGKTNPTSYTKETEDFTLNNPSKKGYEFTGWEGTGLTVPSTNVTIVKGSRGERSYTANYSTIDYTITYDLDGGSLEEGKTNPETYTVETEDFTLNNPSKNGYTFVGWEGTGIEGTTTTVTITKGSTGNRSYKAKYVDNGYTITYDLNGGSLEEGKTNPNTYTSETEDFTLNNPSKRGYDFTGWTGTNVDEPNNNLTITKGTTGNLEFTANYTPTTYHLNYNYDGGNLLPGRTNPETYTIETEDFTLNNPVKTGYNFTGWQEDSSETVSKEVTITTGTIGDKTYTAKYEIKKYSVIYYDEGLQYSSETVEYGKTATKPVDPTKANSIFYYWTLSDGTEFDFDTVINDSNTTDGVLNLYSKYGNIVPPTVTHTPTEWTNGNVTVTITSEHEDYSYKYKIGEEGEYLDYTEPFEVEENTNIIAKSIKGSEESLVTVHEITNIDKEKPLVLSLIQANITNTSFDINTSSIDYESGLKQIDIYKDDVLETTISYSEDVNDEKEVNYSFTGLEEETTYAIKVVATDVAGNVSDSFEKNFKTSQVVVARVIGRDGVLFDDTSLYEDYNKLDTAIKACPDNQCTIQMVLDTVESVEVLEGQDITLDLNGKTVVGVKDTYTIKNSGNFVVVDRSEEIGSIVNRNGVAIKNETIGTLTVGENEEELVVSKTKPYIVGNTIGVLNSYIDEDNKGTFNFYDGLIVGIQAIDGEVNDKPYLYNASVKMRTRQEATLEKLANAEAKNTRTGVYYTQLQRAVNESNSGSLQITISNEELMKSFQNDNSVYGFTYNEETGNLNAENIGKIGDSVAYTIIDLSNYDNDQLLKVTGINSTSDYGANVSVYNYDTTKGDFVSPVDNNNNFKTTDTTIKFVLEKNKKYYVTLTNNNNNNLIVKNITLSDYNLNPIGIESSDDIITSITNYGFDYDEDTRTLRSNNQYLRNTSAVSYFEVDLTNSSSDKDLIMTASLDTLYSYNYGIIKVRENNTFDTSYDTYSDIFAYQNRSYNQTDSLIGPRQYSKTLTKGKKYYVQLYYFKGDDNNNRDYYEQAGSSDQFIINSIDLVDSKLYTGDIPVVTASGEGFSYNSSGYYYNNNSSGNTAHSFIPVDLRNSSQDLMLEFKLDANNVDGFFTVTNDYELPTDENAFLKLNDKYYNGNMVYINLKAGEYNYVHIVTKASSNSIKIYNPRTSLAKSLNLADELKTNKKGFTEFNNGSYYPGNSITNGSTYDSYVKVDLTDEEYDQVLDISAYLSSGSNTKYIYITNNKWDVSFDKIKENRKKTLVYFNASKENYYNESGNNKPSNFSDYKFLLKKGNVYYVHYAMNVDSSVYDYYNYLNAMTLIPNHTDSISMGTIPYLTGTKVVSSDTSYVKNDGTADSNFRFIGSNVKNYVKFNNETWRIIGIFKTEDEDGNIDDRIKIVKDTPLNNTGYSFDTSESSVNGGNGVNEWSESDLMKLLNPGYEDNMDTVYDSDSKMFVEQSINNSLYWNKSSGYCYNNGGNTGTTSCDFTSSGLSEESKTFIDSVKWYTGAFNYSYKDKTVYDLYNLERGAATGKDDIDIDELASLSSPITVDNVERKTSWVGKVGLIYPSDYILASGDHNYAEQSGYTRDVCLDSNMGGTLGACVSTNNWMFYTGMPYYTITPTTGINSTSKRPYYEICINGTPFYSYDSSVCAPFYVKPSVYLNPKTKIKKGTGTEGDPFVFELGDTKNTEEYYGLISDDNPEDDIIYDISSDEDDDYNFIKKKTVYGFDYDEETNTFTNGNKGIPKSLASSYVVIDLTNEIDDVDIIINYSLKQNYNNYAHLNLMEDTYKVIDYNVSYSNSEAYFENNGSIYYNTSYNDSGSINKTLRAGKKYYLQMAYNKKYSYSENMNNPDEFKVNIVYPISTNSTFDYKKYQKSVVLNEKVDTVQILKDITLDESLVVNDTREMILDLNGHTLSSSSSDYVIKNNGSLTILDNKYTKDLTDFEEQYQKDLVDFQEEYDTKSAEYNAEKEAKDAQYEEEYNDAISYTIDDIVQDGIKLNLSSKYHGDVDKVWKDLSNNGDITMSKSWSGTNYLSVNNDYTMNIENRNFETITLESTYNSPGYQGGYLFRSSKKGYNLNLSIPGGDTFENASSASPKVYINDEEKSLTNYVPNDRVNTLALTYDGQTLCLYFNGELVNSLAVEGSITYDSNEIIKLASSFRGELYSARIYNRALSQTEIENNYKVDRNLYTTIVKETFEGVTSNNSTWTGQPAIGGVNHFYFKSSPDENYSYSGLVFTSSKLNLDSKFKLVKGSMRNPVPSGTKIFIGLSKTTNFDTDFVEYKEITTDDYYYNFSPKVLGKYYLKIIYYCNNYYNYNKYNYVDTFYYSPSLDVPKQQTAVKQEAVLNGKIAGYNYSVIYNSVGAYLDVQEANIRLEKSGYYDAITNEGTLRIGESGFVYAINDSNTGINSSGDILYGAGFINAKRKTISVSGNQEKGFGGYRAYNSPVEINSKNEIVLEDMFIQQLSTYRRVLDAQYAGALTIKNSSIFRTIKENRYYTEAIGAPGSINSYLHLINTSVSAGLEPGYGGYRATTAISTSTKLIIDNCNDISGDITVRSSEYSEVNDSTLNSIINVYGNLKLNNSNVNTILYNGMSYENGLNALRIYQGNVIANESTIRGNALLSSDTSLILNQSRTASIIDNSGTIDYNNSTLTNYYINNKGTVTFNESQLTSDYRNGNVINTSAGVATLKSGSTIDKSSIGITGGTINIGENDDTIDNSITINTVNIGIKGDNVNYYDGIISSKLYFGIASPINEIPDGYYINVEENDENESLSLVKNGDYIASIGTNNYTSLQEAIDSVNSTEEIEIKILKNFAVASNYNISDTKNIKLNLNNNSIRSYNKEAFINNSGILTLSDIGDNKKTNVVYGKLVDSSGELNYDNINTYHVYEYGTIINNSGTTTVLDGVFRGHCDGSICNTMIDNSGILTVKNGTFAENGTVVKNTGTAIINGANSESPTNYFKLIDNSGTATLSKMNSNITNIGNNTSNLILEENEFNLLSETLTSSGSLTINSGDYECTKSFISQTAGTLTVNDGNIKSAKSGFAITGSGNLKLNGGIIESDDYGISLSTSSSSTILGGTIKSENIGVYIEKNNTGSITFGTKGDTNDDGTLKISIEDPYILGKNYGIESAQENALVYFYDGIFIGNSSVDSNIAEIEDGVSIVKGVREGYEAKFLAVSYIIKNERTSVEYDNIQTAIDEAENEDKLTLLRETTGLSSDSAFDIASDKVITIDLNGHNLIQSNDLLFENKGTLTLTDNKSSLSLDNNFNVTMGMKGSILNVGSGTIIKNSGNLTLNKISFEDETLGDVITNLEGGIINTNEVYIDKYNKGNGIINGGTVNFKNSYIDISYEESYVSGMSELAISNSGTFTFENSKLVADIPTTQISNTGILRIKSSYILQENNRTDLSTAFNYSLINTSNETEITDSTIKRNIVKNNTYERYGIILSTSPVLNIDNCNFISYYQHFLRITNADAVVNIKDSTVDTAKGIELYGDTSSAITMTLTNNTFKPSTSISQKTESESGGTLDTVNIIGGSYKEIASINRSMSLNVDNSAIELITFFSGNINISNEATIASNISTSDSMDLTITDSTVGGNITTSKSYKVVIDNSLIKGKITGGTDSSIVRVKTGEVKGAISNSNVVLGVKGDLDENNSLKVSTTNPKVSQISNCSVGFYDGVSNGTSIIPYAVEDGYDLIYESNKNYLTKENVIKNITQDKEYNNINDAINEASSGDTLQLLRNMTLYNNVEGTDTNILDGFEITLDLNNQTVYSRVNTLLNNNGTLNIIGSGKITGDIINNGTINVLNGTVSVINNNIATISSGHVNIDNYSSLVINDGTVTLSNKSNATATINSGNVDVNENYSILNINGGRISTLNNYNSGTVIVDDNDDISLSGISSTGNLTINGGTLNGSLYNRGFATITKMTVSNSSSINSDLVLTGSNIIGTMKSIKTGISGSRFTLSNSNIIFTETSNLTGGEINIEGGTFSKTTDGEMFILTTDNFTVKDVNMVAKSEVIKINSSVNNSYPVNIISGTIKSTDSSAISFTYGMVTIGEKNNEGQDNVSTTNPRIEGKNVGIQNNGGTLNFYDGVISANTSPIINYGTINNEDGYKIETNDVLQEDNTTIKKESILTVKGDDSQYAVVNNINYTDLQSAINATKDGVETEVTIYTNIELSDDIVIPENKIVKINLQNQYTINYNGHSFIENGTLTIIGDSSGNNLGGNILNNLNINTLKKNIIIYEMEDGNNLSASNTYKLYIKDGDDYKTVKMKKEEEIGTYTKGNNLEDMRTVRGRIYINNLQSGQYKLVDNKGLESTFVINDDGTLSGKIIENTNLKGKVLSSAVAELVINIQTGMTPAKYGILATLIMIIIGLLAMARKQKQSMN